MKSLRRQGPHDSLYMLLDTMCNAFGGIILLAVLVTLMAKDVSQKREDAGRAVVKKVQQRHLDLAQANLQQSLNLQQTLQERTHNPQLTRLEQKEKLQDQLEALRSEVAAKTVELDAASTQDPADRAKKLNEAATKAVEQQTELTRQIAENNQKAAELQREVAELKSAITGRKNALVQQVHLPKEHPTNKMPVNILIQYGLVYPVLGDNLIDYNYDIISWEKRGDCDAAFPKQGRGFDPVRDAAQLEFYLSLIPKSRSYIAFTITGDSFGAYNRIKPLVAAAGVAYGWEPVTPDELPVLFTTDSSKWNSPLPQ